MVINYNGIKSLLRTIVKSKNNVKIKTPKFKLKVKF